MGAQRNLAIVVDEPACERKVFVGEPLNGFIYDEVAVKNKIPA
jgi:hypothetical protein